MSLAHIKSAWLVRDMPLLLQGTRYPLYASRVTLKSHGKIAYSLSTDCCTACTAHPSLGSGAQHLVPEEEDNYGGFLLVLIVYLGLFSLDCLEILKVISRAV